MNQPVRLDIVARDARERCELRASHCDACAMLAELFRAGYRLFPLGEPDAVPAKPMKIRARYEGTCAACGAPIAEGDAVWWRRDAKGVECAGCGTKAASSHG